MSSQPEQPVSVGSGLSGDVVPGPWQRLLALSGVAFAVLFVVGWFASGGDAPRLRRVRSGLGQLGG